MKDYSQIEELKDKIRLLLRKGDLSVEELQSLVTNTHESVKREKVLSFTGTIEDNDYDTVISDFKRDLYLLVSRSGRNRSIVQSKTKITSYLYDEDRYLIIDSDEENFSLTIMDPNKGTMKGYVISLMDPVWTDTRVMEGFILYKAILSDGKQSRLEDRPI